MCPPAFSHPAWKLSSKYNDIQSYERPLGLVESGFHYDTIRSRTCDVLGYSEVQILEGGLSKITALDKVRNTWISLKVQFPLLGARIEDRDESGLHFVVSEDRIHTCSPDEISFAEVSSQDEAILFADNALSTKDGEHLLSDDLLARVFILLEKGSSDRFYFIFLVAHAITDGIANRTILRTFLESLTRGISTESSSFNMESQLALSVSSDDVDPGRKVSISKQRWRKAIGQIIGRRVMENLKGGQTLPRTVSEATWYTPSNTRLISTSLPPALSFQIIQNCRTNGFTFGGAYYIIGQVAMARLLVRRYLQGQMDEEEWEFRQREPMMSGGPLNLRPYLDKDWQEAGGSQHVCICLAFYFVWISFLPLGEARSLRPGMDEPPRGALLSKDRFFLRARSARRQGSWLANHPLLMDIARSSGRNVSMMKGRALRWQKVNSDASQQPSNVSRSPLEQAASNIVFTSLGSSLGNMDRLLPREYPSAPAPNSFQGIRLHLFEDLFRARAQPAELYLGAQTKRGELRLHANFDSNTYDAALVLEWLNEVRETTVFYLGGESTAQ